ncbi:MAG: type II secretion system minor pseudopilin GspH [Gammaproteobacteria bacterium]|nr:type II secretion system minor pseudopilin GspH [Gammaproteobacteria bacterium]
MSNRIRQRGFTLLELMIVVVIISILLAAALLSMSFTSMERVLKEEGQRFSALLSYAREEAILQTLDLGFQVDESGFRFMFLDPATGQWVSADFDEVLRPRSFPSDIQATIWIEGAGFDLGDPDAKDVDPGNLPQVFILSSGEVSPFELILTSNLSPRKVTISGQLDGKAKVEIDDPAF